MLLTISSYKSNVKLAGIIYLHRISDNRLQSGSPLQNLEMFGRLCGEGGMKNIVLATTMWTKVKSAEVGIGREQELKNTYWAGMLVAGSRLMRFGDVRFDAAWKIIDGMDDTQEIKEDGIPQEELVNLGRRLNETETGKTLYSKLEQLLADQKETIRKLRENTELEEEHSNELAVQYRAMQDTLQSAYEYLGTMKIPIGRRLWMLFSFRTRSRDVTQS